MWKRLRTTLNHLWLDESDTRRLIAPEVLARLERHIAASESRHTGEIRIYAEASLPPGYLWRHLWHKTPIEVLARQRAMIVFGKLRVWDTEHNNGLLIYLLLAERKIELVADRGINAVVGQTDWQAMVTRMGAAFAAGHFEHGLMQAVDEVSRPLLEHFALQPDVLNTNELPDAPELG